MPSITPFELPTFSTNKKRRRDDDHDETQMSLYASPKSFLRSSSANFDVRSRTIQHNESTNLLSTIDNNERLILPSSGRGTSAMLNMPRKVIPLPVNKRFRLVNDDDEHDSQPTHYSSQQSHHSHAHPEYTTPPTSPQHSRPSAHARANIPALLSPCHICHRKPTKKSDLDSFADCMGCGQRACFVCIRACQGWLPPSEEEENLSASFTMHDVDDNHTYDNKPDQKKGKGGGWNGRGHREMICSRCCVERGREGDVVCLGCLAGMEGV
ncbi:uncharacterized protein GGS22DRAFT_5827 [Annulohypoxylon maeteangense]|uniref:uncharacterized protein n=1 Tax=Annulohypoxylon maeteangense TaxID=1927788 RepID=UPI002007E921|nr:uncharacterized protein GGS22DRAFT_5827 [Annulohypoxylon maeteangense]KAI0889906.1 hypothetical protein GGS22DRAFT_5827 [Annulohypoxylon maeteangense]